jgi:hypothetical protein
VAFQDPTARDPVVEIGRSGRSRKGAIVAVLLLVGLGGGAYVAGRTSNSTGAPTTTTTNSTVAPTTTARSTTTARPTTTTTAVVAAGRGAILPEPTGQRVYAVDQSGDVYRVDLDTGDITHYELNHRFENVAGIAVIGDEALVFDAYDYNVDAGPLYRPGDGHAVTVYTLKPDGSVATIRLEVAAAQRLADPTAGGVWLIGRNADGMPAALVDATGASTVFVNIPPGLNPIGADGGGIVAAGASGTFRVDQGGPRRLTTGSLIGLSAGYLVASTCDDQFRCTVSRTERQTGDIDEIGPIPASLAAGSDVGEVSPDGNAVALLVFGPSEARLVQYDLVSNEITEITTQVFGPRNNVAWTSTGWLVHVEAGVLELTRGAERRDIDVAPGRSSASLVALGVGPAPSANGV